MRINYLSILILNIGLIMYSCSSDLPLDVVIEEPDEINYKKQGEDFLAENKKRTGVLTTASGLQYEILKKTEGPKPTSTTKVQVHYHGTTPDGDVFDSSVDRNKPAEFGLNQVIKGWTEGLQLMSEGSKYRFFIPQELAYGASPHPNSPIEPYMALIFDVELLEIK